MTEAEENLRRENARLRARLRRMVYGKETADRRMSQPPTVEGGCMLSPDEMELMHRMSARGDD